MSSTYSKTYEASVTLSVVSKAHNAYESTTQETSRDVTAHTVITGKDRAELLAKLALILPAL